MAECGTRWCKGFALFFRRCTSTRGFSVWRTTVRKPELNLCLGKPGLATGGSLGRGWGLTSTWGASSVSALDALARMNILEPWWFLLRKKKDCFLGWKSWCQTGSAGAGRYSEKQVIIQILSATQELVGFSPWSEPASGHLSAFLRLISIAKLARQIRCLRQRILMCHQLGQLGVVFWASAFTCLPAARTGDGNNLSNMIWW